VATIVVVEDEPATLRLIAALLGAKGHRVVTLADGAALAATVRAERPALVLLDLGLPGKDGFALLAELRGAPPTARTRVGGVHRVGERRARAGGRSGIRRVGGEADLAGDLRRRDRAATWVRRGPGGGGDLFQLDRAVDVVRSILTPPAPTRPAIFFPNMPELIATGNSLCTPPETALALMSASSFAGRTTVIEPLTVTTFTSEPGGSALVVALTLPFTVTAADPAGAGHGVDRAVHGDQFQVGGGAGHDNATVGAEDIEPHALGSLTVNWTRTSEELRKPCVL